ncbi:phosphate ABC transporter permease subunit PstC [Candidatus Bathyarchaeota archaeon RBG_13_38_9]|nr:MAG: phosphate ABC transporter permease subunit PstC [Candidatus Bathyarchaeota archaeon RBG_13_38_9]
MKRQIREAIIEKGLFLAASASIIIVMLIIIFMFAEGIRALNFDFLFGMEWWPSGEKFGIIPTVVSTFIIGLGALGIAIIIGIPCAIFLSEYSRDPIRSIIKSSVEMLVGIPSIVLGFFGLVVLVPLIRYNIGGLGESILAGWIILSIMTLPHIISISEDAMRAVPNSFREGSIALGSTTWQTTKALIIPNAKSGIFASIVLGMGNAIGETMAVLMVIGNPNIPWIPQSILDQVRVLTSTIVIEISYAIWGSMHQYSLFALGIVLFAVVSVLNLISRLIIKEEIRKRW